MNLYFHHILCLLLGIVPIAGNAPQSLAQSDAIRQFGVWDAQNNPGFGGQDTNSFAVEHLEIAINSGPLKTFGSLTEYESSGAEQGLVIDLAEYLPDRIRRSLIVNRDGQEFVRFILAPGDTKYGPALINWLKREQIPFERGSYFRGMRTASRSIILTDPANNLSFSVKPSSNVQTKLHSDDPNPIRWAHLNRRLSDTYHELRGQLQFLEIAWEAGMVGTPNFQGEGADIAYQIRLMENVSAGSNYQMSGFVYQDKEEARRIAERAGMDYDEFWQRAFYIKARATVELSAILGFWTESAHDQNFRWELDANGRLTGKVIILDLADGAPLAGVWDYSGRSALLREWHQRVGETNPLIHDRLAIVNFSHVGGIETNHQSSYESGLVDGLTELTGFKREYVERLAKAGVRDVVFPYPLDMANILKWQPTCTTINNMVPGQN